MTLGLTTRKNLAVLVPEFGFAPAAVIGAVYCTNTFAPKQLKWLTDVICDKIVEPHLDFFKPYEDSIQRAHEIHDLKKQEEAKRHGITLPTPVPAKEQTKHERAEIIAGVIADGAVAMGADLAATLGGQHLLNKHWNAGVPVTKTALAESGAHLALMATLPRFAARTGENIHHGIKGQLQKILGMSDNQADDISIPFTYVAIPGQLASLLSLAIAHSGKAPPGAAGAMTR